LRDPQSQITRQAEGFAGFLLGVRGPQLSGTLMLRLLLIAAGGGIGSVLRYLVQGWGQKLANGSFPLGTLIVNVLGCLSIGFLNYIFSGPIIIRQEYRIALTVGLLGGFTTFSSFGWETFALANERQGLAAIMNLLLSVTLGFSAVLIGYRLGEKWLGV
jgi:CrcB protein